MIHIINDGRQTGNNTGPLITLRTNKFVRRPLPFSVNIRHVDLLLLLLLLFLSVNSLCSEKNTLRRPVDPRYRIQSKEEA